ncbi:MAG: glycosyltransferase family 4 protein [Putridiphycobacter sp.]|nr:glycosyltransferase family 4 protein [Putridiphycobacter sp.]
MKILFIQKVKALVGSEKYFLELIPALQKNGIAVTFACIYNSKDKDKTQLFIEQCKELDINIKYLEVSSDKSIIKTLKFLRQVFQNDHFDLVHSHLIHADLWATILKRFKIMTCPIVSTKHGYDENYIAKNGFEGSTVPKNLYYRLCQFSEKKIARSFAVSHGLRTLFVDSKICKAENIETIHHGFELPSVNSQLNSKFRASKNQLIIIGRVIPFKGHLHLIRALATVKQEFDDVSLVILGHGDKQHIKALKNEAKLLNVDDHIVFAGYQTNIYDYLVNSDIMIVPSIAEGFGLVFLEAMNAKLPIIGFDVPATNEIIENEKTGFLIPPYNESLLAEAICRLLKSPEERLQFGQNAKNKLDSYFCLSRMLDETICFYKKVLNQ